MGSPGRRYDGGNRNDVENFSGRKEDVGFWLQQMVFHFSDTDEYYHLPITHDYKLILE